jgi:pimeloyl-ACP methyl ester carboxylesterase
MKILFSFVAALLFLTACNPNAHKKGVAVNEKSLISLGGEKQYVEITGASNLKPVLLFIHGGPGWPQTPFLRYYNADIAKNFILVSWDQRGCGKTYLNNPNPENMTLQQIVADAHQLTAYLKDKFQQQKIYIAGFSWGSIVGLQLAQQYPEDYEAYIGISQVINMKKGMEVSQLWLTDQATKAKDTATLQVLQKLKSKDTAYCKTDMDCFMKQYELLNKYKGATYNDSIAALEQKIMTMYDDYKGYDWNKAFAFSSSRLAKDMFAADFTKIESLKIPVYFLSGDHDWLVPSVITNLFIDNVSAPNKKLFQFKNSGHNLLEEEAGEFNETIMYKIISD